MMDFGSEFPERMIPQKGGNLTPGPFPSEERGGEGGCRYCRNRACGVLRRRVRVEGRGIEWKRSTWGRQRLRSGAVRCGREFARGGMGARVWWDSRVAAFSASSAPFAA